MTRLRLLRMQRGLTQREMAALLGFDPSFLSRLERAWFTRCPKRAAVEKQFKAFFGPGESFETLMAEASPDERPIEEEQAPVSMAG